MTTSRSLNMTGGKIARAARAVTRQISRQALRAAHRKCYLIDAVCMDAAHKDTSELTLSKPVGSGTDVHVGLVSGIGPAATDYYYRRLIAAAAAGGTALELTMAHADSPTLLANQERDDEAAQVEIFLRLTQRLEAAGAKAVAITSIAGHFCIEAFKAASPLTVIDLLQETDSALQDMGIAKAGVLGTRIAMETRLYGAIESVEIVPPAGQDLAEVHDAYVTMAAAGTASDAQRDLFLSASRRLIDDQGAEAVMLGGTDLALVFEGRDAGFRVIDCARLHIDAIARLAAA